MFHVWVRRNHILEFPLITPQDQDLYLLAFFLLLQIFILIQKQAWTNYLMIRRSRNLLHARRKAFCILSFQPVEYDTPTDVITVYI